MPEKKLVFYLTASNDPKGSYHTITIAHPKQDLSDQGTKAERVYQIGAEIANSGMFATAEGLALDTFQKVNYEYQVKNPVINNKAEALAFIAKRQADKLQSKK